jgi:isoleucyl-tRNA synthetase
VTDNTTPRPKSDYKDTLNLPTTRFDMRASLPQREPAAVDRWRAQDTYARMIARRREQGAPRFIMHDGPPYANGHIHIGHILNKILKDVVVKYRNLSGFQAEFIPGWDCHGLPIELKAEEELRKAGKDRASMTDIELRAACRAYAERFIDIQREDFRRLLILADWDAPYKTLDPQYEADTVRELGRLIDGGYLTKGLKPVFWSWAAQTALAEAEVEYPEDAKGNPVHVSPSIYVKFPLIDPPAALQEAAAGRPISAVIWTTTPWTLPANLGISFLPGADYSLVATAAGDALILADALVDEVAKVCHLGEVERLLTFKPDDLLAFYPDSPRRTYAQHPFIADRESLLMLGEHVTLDTGTGAVHTAPGHGVDDFIIGRAYGLPILSPVDNAGRFTAEVPDYEGLNVFAVNPKVIERLAASGHLLSAPTLSVTHRYPYCWRTNKPIIFRATEQWFISIDHDTLRERALDAIAQTRWLPAWGEDRIKNMIANRPDWCITRQRRWGVPLPILYCEGCGTPMLTSAVAQKLAAFSEVETTDAWWTRPASDFAPEGATCGGCGAHGPWRKEPDIVDVWIDSGVSFAAVTDRRLGGDQGQADLYLEGSDQHRGWFHSSLLCSVATRRQAPYKAVLTHGFVMDGKGEKISKSKGNYVPPEKILSQYGAEILRIWVIAEDFSGDLRFSEDIVKQFGEAYRKLRNTWRFMLSALPDFSPDQHMSLAADLTPLDQWALLRAQDWLKRVRDGYEDYNFTSIFQETVRFANIDLSAFYLDVCKDRLYASGASWPERRAAQSTIYLILHAMLRALAPVLSFTAEEAWESLPKRADDPDSVFLTDFPQTIHPDPAATPADPAAFLAEWDLLLSTRDAALQVLEAARRDKRIGSSQQADVTLTAPAETLARLRALNTPLDALLIVSRVTLSEGDAPTNNQPVSVVVTPSSAQKCPRCWNHREDIGAVPAFPDVCGRCARALS